MEAKKLSDRHPTPYRLSLHIRHPSIDPAEISRELSIEAEQSFAAGQPRKTRTLSSAAVHSESYWVGMMSPELSTQRLSWWSHLEPGIREALFGNISTMIAWSCNRLVMGHRDFLRRINAEGGRIRLLVTLAPGELRSFSVSPEMSRMLGEFGITIEFEQMRA